jgi:DNA-binding NarL/FixJ family response regulator
MSLPSTSIRVLVADGHPIVLEGLRSALGHQPGIQVVGEASDGMEAIE